MNIAFRCRLSYNSDIPKIRKFFEDTDTITFAAGKAGIALCAITKDEACYYIVEIHACDILQLEVKDHIDTSGNTIHPTTSSKMNPTWEKGGIVRLLPATTLINFIKTKEENNDLQLEIDKDGTILSLKIMNEQNIKRAVNIPLSIPDTVYEYPQMTWANVVIMVNEFKKICSELSKASSEITIETQSNAMRMSAGQHHLVYGTWVDNAPSYECMISNTAFIKATKINIGNTKNSHAGLYVYPKLPPMIRVKLGIIDFLIYSKTWIR